MIDLSGRAALVTGASRGIGRATALALAAAGADVAVNFRVSEEEARGVAEEAAALGAAAVAVRADVSERDDVRGLVDAVAGHFGRLDIVVSNAAAGGFRPATRMTPAHLESVLRANAAPLAWLAADAADLLADDAPGAGGRCGKVVAVSSHGGRWAVPNYAAVGASKAALESIARSLAIEIGPRGINVNVVLPGIVATEAVRSMPGVEGLLRGAGERMMTARREITPDDVAGAIAFLCSPLSDMVQGETLVVDGGTSVRA